MRQAFEQGTGHFGMHGRVAPAYLRASVWPAGQTGGSTAAHYLLPGPAGTRLSGERRNAV